MHYGAVLLPKSSYFVALNKSEKDMNRKTMIIAVLAGAGLLGALALSAQKFGALNILHKNGSSQNATNDATSSAQPDSPKTANPDQPHDDSAPREYISTSPAPPPDPEHEKYVEETADKLSRLGMMDDAASREAIMAEFKNPDRRIRQEALDAIIQFGDRSVIPRLEEIAAQTEDPIEQKEIIDAIEYIKLPSLTEYLAEQERLKKAQGQR